jgi:diguanylate cyclase (GGDEF)-like protein/PAS domain S-box-containing protein
MTENRARSLPQILWNESQLAFPAILAILLIFCSYYNYLLFHTLTEFFAVFVGVLMFAVAWNTYPYSNNHFLMFIASGYFWIALLDLIHTLAYKGMSIFPITEANLATQFWIVPRYFEALILLAAPYFLTRRLQRNGTFLAMGCIALLFSNLVLSGYFPDAYIEGAGLTRFKIFSEYLIILLLMMALWRLNRKRELLQRNTFHLLVISIVFSMGAELAFTFYISVYGLSNLIGHIFKLFSFWLLFVAVIKNTLTEPYSDLKASENKYRTLLNNVPQVLIWQKDRNLAYVSCNKNLAQLYRTSPEEIVGKTDFDFHPKELAVKYFADDQHIMATAETQEYDESYIRRGEKHFAHTIKAPLLDKDGVCSGTLGIAMDITERVRAEEKLRLGDRVFDASPAHISVIGRDYRYRRVNKSYVRAHGIAAEKIAGQHVASLLGEEVFEKTVKPQLDHCFGGEEVYFKSWFDFRVAGRRYMSVSYLPLRSESGEIKSLVVLSRDITERWRNEEALRLAATAFEAHEGIIITDVDAGILRVNQAFTHITGYSEEEVHGDNPRILQSGRHDRAFYRDLWSTLEKYGYWHGEIWNRRKRGEIYPEWLSITAVRNRQGETIHYVGHMQDITEKKRAASLEHHVYYDPLTDLANRRFFEELLQRSVDRAKRHNHFGVLMFLDLDGFKSVNDSLGHNVGDELLQEVAQRLERRIRKEDLAARLGGDEFVILLPEVADSEVKTRNQAESLAEKIRQTLAAPHRIQGHEIISTTSIGITLFPLGEESGQRLLHEADTAMYQAKKEGRNTVRLFQYH